MSEEYIEAGEDLEHMSPAERQRKKQHDAFMRRVLEREDKTSHDLAKIDRIGAHKREDHHLS
jgi:hypothetical protein